MASAYKEVTVMLRGGLNTALDPSIIGETQLQEASGMEYRPPRLGLFACKGRTRGDTGTMGGAKTFGLAFCQPDGAPANGYLVALASPSGVTAFGYAASSQSDGSLAFTVITPVVPTATHLWASSATAFADAVHANACWHFYNGANKNLVLRELDFQNNGGGSLSWYQHGLIDVTAAGTAVATATGAGGASYAFATGTYELWHTEASSFIFASDGVSIRSAFSGTVQQVTITAAGTGIKYTYPSPTTNRQVVLGIVFCTLPGQKYPFGFEAGSAFFAAGTSYLVQPDTTTPYPTVGAYGAVPVSANSEPPKAYAMAMFKGSLCLIDVEDRTALWHSLPGDPAYFPSINYVQVDTEFKDAGNALLGFGDILLWFSNRHTIRFNYLPRYTDSQDITAGRGDCWDVISKSHGCLSPRGVCSVETIVGEFGLFVCTDGIHITDGEHIGYATEDIDWDATVSKANLNRCVLKNNAKKHRVEFYYVDATDTTKFKRLDLYYHPLLIQTRTGFPHLPVLGPLQVPGLASAVGYFGSDTQVWAGDDNNPRVWIESTGTSDGAILENADGRITKAWRTKNFYFAGVQGEYELYKVYTHQSQTTASGSYTITGEGKTDDTATSFTVTSTVDQTETGAQPHPALHARAQRFSVRGEKTDGGAWQELNYLVFVVKGGSELHSAKSS